MVTKMNSNNILYIAMEKGYLHNYVHIGFGKFDMESRIDEYYPKGRILPESQEVSFAIMPFKEFKKYFNIKIKPGEQKKFSIKEIK